MPAGFLGRWAASSMGFHPHSGAALGLVAGGGGYALDFKAEEIGAGLLDGVADGEIKGDGGGAGPACALEAEAGEVVFEAQEFHVAAVALHVGADFFQGFAQAGVDIDGVQAVDKKHAADDASFPLASSRLCSSSMS